jgi:DNA-binding protein YbaB
MKDPQTAATEKVSETLTRFRDDPRTGAEATAQDLVRVRMYGRMQVSEVSILGDTLPPDLRARLEQAFVEAAQATQDSLIDQMGEAVRQKLSVA